MAQRITQFARTMNYFRTADLAEAAAAFRAVELILSHRKGEEEPRRRARKEKPAAEQAAAATTNG